MPVRECAKVLSLLFLFSGRRRPSCDVFVLFAVSLFLLPGCLFTQQNRQTATPAPAAKEPVKVIPFEAVEGPVIEIDSKEQFLKIIDSGGVCFVLLYSRDCGPCRFMEPVMKLIAGRYAETVTVCKVDIDRIYYAIKRYDPKGYPTILIIKNAKEVRRFLGTRPPGEYFQALDELTKENKQQVLK